MYIPRLVASISIAVAFLIGPSAQTLSPPWPPSRRDTQSTALR